MTPKQQAVEDMMLVGAQMANLCFNFGQRPDEKVGDRNAQIMRALQTQWDYSVRQYRKLTKKARA